MQTKIIYQKLLAELREGRKAAILTKLDSNQDLPITRQLLTENDLEKINSLYLKEQNDGILIEPYYPPTRMVILGGGHIAKSLVEFGAGLGFLITVVDDRPSFANQDRFPQANEIICQSFERCFPFLKLNSATFVIIVTRGHRHDFLCLKEALKYDLAYLGMIGSRRRVKGIKEILLEQGYSGEQLNRLYAPIGLEIGALTPEEIAISILAQIIAVRRLGENKEVQGLEFDQQVIGELAYGLPEPKGVVTVISTKGSVPRKTGAKMIVWPDGRILGSICGGCVEAEAISKAREIIQKGGYQLSRIDLSNEVAEEEGMVCGGMMELLIECCL